MISNLLAVAIGVSGPVAGIIVAEEAGSRIKSGMTKWATRR